MDDWAARQWELMDHFTGVVRTEVGSLRKELADHMKNPEAHPQANAETRALVRTLWDERNETRGMLRVFAFVITPMIGIGGPVLAVVASYFLHHN